MSKKELKAYFDWFLGQISARILELEGAIKNESHFVAWNADRSPESLELLGIWFASQVKTRRRTDEDIDEISAMSSFPFAIPDQELTNRTFSLAMDAGMYLAETLLSQHSSLQWMQLLDNKKYADYGQPVLGGFGPVPLNPVRVLVTMAYGVADGKQNGQRLYSLYDYWAKQAASFRI